MSDLIDEFVKELMETGSTGDSNPPLPKKMLRRTPGQWSWHYVPDKGKAIFVEDGSNDTSDLHPTDGDMQLMTYSADMHKILWSIADLREFRDLAPYTYNSVIEVLAKIYVEPPEDYVISDRALFTVQEFREANYASRNTGD